VRGEDAPGPVHLSKPLGRRQEEHDVSTRDLTDRSARLTLSEAADLAGVSTKTLTRDRDAGKLTMVNDPGGWIVTVGALIDSGRYTPRPGETTVERLGRGRLEARIRELEAELGEARRGESHARELLDQATAWVAFLQGIVSQQEVR
jgi:hypothetical protein